jgi:hypothetical protein
MSLFFLKFYNSYFPWGKNGKSPTYDYCACCGVEFGYRDETLEGVRNFRKQWLSKGANWHYVKMQPEDWDLEAQLKQIPIEYL